MSHNPTYDPEPGYDFSPAPGAQDFSNMASYRQATTGQPPASTMSGDQGKSYRYATDAIPEDEDEEMDNKRGVQFTNGGEPTKRYSAPKDSSGGFWSRYKVHILAAIAILFAILFIIFLALYIVELTKNPDGSPQTDSAPSAGAVQQSTTTATTPTTTVAVPTNDLGVYPAGSGTKVMKYTIKNSKGTEVELLSLGARMNKFIVSGTDIVLGFNTDSASTTNLTEIAAELYGVASGRICGKATLPIQYDGQNYSPPAFDGQTDLKEGGKRGFYQLNFEGKAHPDGKGVTFTRDVSASDDGLLGNLKVQVEYTLNDDNQLMVKMMATTTSSKAIVDMCNSARFNLLGKGEDVSTHQLTVPDRKAILPGVSGWSTQGGYLSFQQYTDLKTGIDKLIANVNPSAVEYGTSFQITGPTGLKYAGSMKGNNREVKIYTNQPVLSMNVMLKSTKTVAGKNNYGAKSAVEIIAHRDTVKQDINDMILKSGEIYQSFVMYQVS